MIWWPVVLALVTAPFGTYGVMWLKEQRILAAHTRTLDEVRKDAEKRRQAAYELGWREGIAQVRDEQRAKIEETRRLVEQMERELADANDKAAVTPTPATEIIEACKRSASCRDRRALK